MRLSIGFAGRLYHDSSFVITQSLVILLAKGFAEKKRKKEKNGMKMESKKVKLTIYWIINGSTVIINTWTPWLMHLSWCISRSQTHRLRAEDTATLSYRSAGNPNFDRRAELHFDFKKNAWYALESVSHRYHNVSRETISLVQTEEGHVITRFSEMKRSQWMMLRLPWW